MYLIPQTACSKLPFTGITFHDIRAHSCPGLALLQRHGQSSKSFEDLMEAPKDHIQEAVALHKFAVAAYTVMHKKFIISVFEFIILILFKLFHGAGSFT
jgi:hypothetical protein